MDEVDVVDETKAVGITCLLCGGPADQMGRFCIDCIGPVGPARRGQARSLSLAPAHLKLMQALRWPLVLLLLAGVGLAGARAAQSWVATRGIGHVTAVGRAALDDARISAVVHLERQLSLIQVGTTVAIGAVFLTWWALAYRNLTAMGIHSRNRTTWAVASWFIPLVSLVAPKRVAEELWWGSDADTPLGWSYRRGAVSALVTGWWACWLASVFLPPLGLAGVSVAAATRPNLVAAVVAASGVAFVLSAVMLAIAGLCAAALVVNVTAGQVERAQAIEEAGLVTPLA